MGWWGEGGEGAVGEVEGEDECLCSGSGVGVVPGGSVTFRGEKTVFQEGGIGVVGQALYDELTGLQSGKVQDKLGWLENVPEGFHE